MGKTDIFNLCEEPPKAPAKDPEMIEAMTRNVPQHVRLAAKQAAMSVMPNYMTHVWFRYKDNTLKEPKGFHCTVKASGTGKGYIDTMCENLLRERIEQSNTNIARLGKVSKKNRTKGDGKDKQARPEGKEGLVTVPPEDITHPGMLLQLEDAEAAGDEPVELLLAEVDYLNDIMGGHKRATKFIRKIYDRKRVGAYRATDSGVTGNPVGRVNITVAGTENSARKFFGKDDDIENGSLGRFTITYMPHDDKTGDVVQGSYDEQWHADVQVYIDRLKAAHGEIELPQGLMDQMRSLNQQLQKASELSNNKAFAGWWHRSLEMAFIRACILYVGQGYYGKVEEEWVEWSLWHDLYSKMLLFMPMAQKQSFTIDYAEVRRCGPKNLMDQLPDPFTRADVIKLRESMTMDLSATSVSNMLYNWKRRHLMKPVAGAQDTYSKCQ